MLGVMKRIICANDPPFYETHIRPIIHKRWDKMNNLLYMAAYVVNPKRYELGTMPLYKDK